MSKIAFVKIKNIMGIDELEFAPDGTLTEITGKNGRGKTSVLQAIQSVTGAPEAQLLRKGAEQGEVVLVLDDGTELVNKVTADKSTKSVIRDGKKVARPAEVIKQLTDLLSVNPIEFLTARKQDRARVLLESMPIELDVAALAKAAGRKVDTVEGLAPLDVIDAIHKRVFEDRTGTNRAVKEKDATINQMRQVLPEVPAGVSANEDELREQVEAARGVAAAEKQRIDTKLAGLRTTTQAAIDAARAAAQEKIALLQEQIAQEKADAEAAITAQKDNLARLEGLASKQETLNAEKLAAAVAPLNEQLALIRNNREMFAKREQALETIATMEKELVDLEKDAASQTAALARIDAYRDSLISKLPIPGLVVAGGEITRDGILFDRLNTAQQVQIAIEIAKLRAGELAIACIDNFEMLDPEAFEEFKARAAESNLQLFVTRVSGEEFTVQ